MRKRCQVRSICRTREELPTYRYGRRDDESAAVLVGVEGGQRGAQEGELALDVDGPALCVVSDTVSVRFVVMACSVVEGKRGGEKSTLSQSSSLNASRSPNLENFV